MEKQPPYETKEVESSIDLKFGLAHKVQALLSLDMVNIDNLEHSSESEKLSFLKSIIDTVLTVKPLTGNVEKFIRPNHTWGTGDVHEYVTNAEDYLREELHMSLNEFAKILPSISNSIGEFKIKVEHTNFANSQIEEKRLIDPQGISKEASAIIDFIRTNVPITDSNIFSLYDGQRHIDYYPLFELDTTSYNYNGDEATDLEDHYHVDVYLFDKVVQFDINNSTLDELRSHCTQKGFASEIVLLSSDCEEEEYGDFYHNGRKVSSPESIKRRFQRYLKLFKPDHAA